MLKLDSGKLRPGTPLSDDLLVREVATFKARTPELVEAFGPQSVGDLRSLFGGLGVSEIGALRKAERAALLGATRGVERDNLPKLGALWGMHFGQGPERAAHVKNDIPMFLEDIAQKVGREMNAAHVAQGLGTSDLQNPWTLEGLKLAGDARGAAQRIISAKGSDRKILAQAAANEVIFKERYLAWHDHRPAPTFDLAHLGRPEQPTLAEIVEARPVLAQPAQTQPQHLLTGPPPMKMLAAPPPLKMLTSGRTVVQGQPLSGPPSPTASVPKKAPSLWQRFTTGVANVFRGIGDFFRRLFS